MRGNRVGSLETALKENIEILNELDRKLDQLIYLQKAAQATANEINEGFEGAVSGTVRQGAEAKVPLQGIENRNEGGKQWQ